MSPTASRNFARSSFPSANASGKRLRSISSRSPVGVGISLLTDSFFAFLDAIPVFPGPMCLLAPFSSPSSRRLSGPSGGPLGTAAGIKSCGLLLRRDSTQKPCKPKPLMADRSGLLKRQEMARSRGEHLTPLPTLHRNYAVLQGKTQRSPRPNADRLERLQWRHSFSAETSIDSHRRSRR